MAATIRCVWETTGRHSSHRVQENQLPGKGQDVQALGTRTVGGCLCMGLVASMVLWSWDTRFLDLRLIYIGMEQFPSPKSLNIQILSLFRHQVL